MKRLGEKSEQLFFSDHLKQILFILAGDQGQTLGISGSPGPKGQPGELGFKGRAHFCPYLTNASELRTRAIFGDQPQVLQLSSSGQL